MSAYISSIISKCNSCNAAVINGHASHEHKCTGKFIFINKGRTYERYTVWSLDTLGNPKDGFEVNDRSKLGTITVPENPSDRAIIKALKEKEFIPNKRLQTRSFKIDVQNWDYNIDIDWKRTGEPLFQLERL
jgi:hypothetical protein